MERKVHVVTAPEHAVDVVLIRWVLISGLVLFVGFILAIGLFL